MNFLIIFLLFTLKIAFVFGLNSMRFKLFQYEGSQNFKFTSNFESMHLLKSYKINRKTLSLEKCLTTNLENSSIKAITYQVNNDSTIECKLYSPSVIEFTDLITTTGAVKLYLSTYITISSSTTSTLTPTTSLTSTTSTRTSSIATTTKSCKIKIFKLTLF